MSGSYTIEYSVKDAPTLARFHASGAAVRGVRGPVGSGKSVAMCMEIVRRSLEQEPGPDGYARSRWAVIRNTYPELTSTTIKTWVDWIKPQYFGSPVYKAPITHTVKLGSKRLVEVIFLALDREEDVKKLLSLELTGVWLNEARELPKAVLDMATGRVGRYPAQRDGGPTWYGVIMDTNSPSDDHWWYELAEEERPQGYHFFAQPSGLSPEAENLPNLPPNYYRNMMAGKSREWINVYVHGKYGDIEDGKPVWPEFNHLFHVSQSPLKVYNNRPLLIGQDFGLTPAAVICQISPRGQFRVLAEVVSADMGIRRFIMDALKPVLAMEYPDVTPVVYGDPAGSQRAQTDERTCFDEFIDARLAAYPAHTNNFAARREAVAFYLTKYIDKQPGMLIDPRCRTLIKGLGGRYRYRKMQVSGTARYTDQPEKNEYSHVCEALQYAALSTDMISVEIADVGEMPGRLL